MVFYHQHSCLPASYNQSLVFHCCCNLIIIFNGAITSTSLTSRFFHAQTLIKDKWIVFRFNYLSNGMGAKNR